MDKVRFSWLALGLFAISLTLAGCGPPRDLRSGIDPERLEHLFDASQIERARVEQLNSAIQSNRYADAILILRRIISDPRLSLQQKATAQDLMAEIQSILAHAAERGDTNALEAIAEYEKRTGRPHQP